MNTDAHGLNSESESNYDGEFLRFLSVPPFSMPLASGATGKEAGNYRFKAWILRVRHV